MPWGCAKVCDSSGGSPAATTIFPVTTREITAFRVGRRRSRRGSLVSDSSREGNAQTPGAPMRYPMYVMSWEVVMGLERMVAHQILMRSGRLAKWSESMLGRVFLISHEWLGYAHPDPAGEQLAVLKGTLLNLASGAVTIQSDWKEQMFRKSNERLQGHRLATVLPICYFWLDYSGVPQALDNDKFGAHAKSRFEAGEIMHAVHSIPAYVERSSALLVLTPTCQHRDVPDRVCGFASWRGRGWCRVELCAALLSRTRVRLVRCIGMQAVPELMFGSDALYLPPGLGAYTCCARGHSIDGRSIECDKVQLSDVVSSMVEAAAEHLHLVGDSFLRRVLLCSRGRFLRGLVPQAGAGAEEAAMDVLAFQSWLRWGPGDIKASATGAAPSLLHWAALAGNATVIAALLAKDRRGIDSPMPLGAPDSGLFPHLPPLHLAAFAADGRADAMEALLQAGARADLRDALSAGCFAPMYAVMYGTLQQTRAWFRHCPKWDLELCNRSHGATMVTLATFHGPMKARFLAFLIEQKANVRAGEGSAACADAALLAACSKDDSDPEVVDLLLRAGCSANVVCRPPWRRWRLICAGMRLAARLAGLRGRRPGPLVGMLADLVGSTPLHLAARSGDTAVMRLLLQAQADPQIRNAMGRTALDLARLRFGGHAPDLVEALLPTGSEGYDWGSERCDEAPGLVEEFN